MTRLFLGLFFGLSLALPASAMGGKPGGYTLFLVPAKFATVQIGRDFADRQQVLLMTYEVGLPPEAPFLNAWSGDRWVRVPVETFAAGTFARSRPGRAVIVGSPNAQVARLIELSAAWTPQVLNIESEATADLVNSMGRFFQFRQREWEWYAARYQLKLEDLNYEARHQSWYDTHTASMLPPAGKPFQPPLPPVQVREGTVNRSRPAQPLRANEVSPSSLSADAESFSFDPK